MIENNEYVISKKKLSSIEALPQYLESQFNHRVLRWYVSKIDGDDIIVECTVDQTPGLGPRPAVTEVFPGKSVVVNVVPTGIGCDIGGYAADAAPATSLLASCCDYLITNPNAVNASNFISKDDNVLYTEGYMIDLFSKGEINLYKPYTNKVGLIVEKAEPHELEVVFNIVNTVRAVHGVDIETYIITDQLLGGFCEQNKSGAYVGKLADTSILFDACKALIAKGVNAIAVTSNIKGLPVEEYAEHFCGKHPNPVGGAEAIISHLICREFNVPAAHAPMINKKDMVLESNIVDARGAGEFASESGLACILIGLSKAPQMSLNRTYRMADAVNINNLLAVVAPAGALGGIPMIYAHRNNIPVIAVRQNRTILNVTYPALELANVWETENYAEAAGLIQALRNGINIGSIYRPLETLRF